MLRELWQGRVFTGASDDQGISCCSGRASAHVMSHADTCGHEAQQGLQEDEDPREPVTEQPETRADLHFFEMNVQKNNFVRKSPYLTLAFLRKRLTEGMKRTPCRFSDPSPRATWRAQKALRWHVGSSPCKACGWMARLSGGQGGRRQGQEGYKAKDPGSQGFQPARRPTILTGHHLQPAV